MNAEMSSRERPYIPYEGPHDLEAVPEFFRHHFAQSPDLNALENKVLSRITANGAADSWNLLARDMSYHFACIYRIHDDQRAASRAAEWTARILTRLADVVPTWPLIPTARQQATYGVTHIDRHAEDPEGQELYRRYLNDWRSNGLWGVWSHGDLKAGMPVVRAFDLIYDSGIMQELGVEGHIKWNLIAHIADHYLGRPLGLGNLTHNALEWLPFYGVVISEPIYVEVAMQRYRYMMHAMYYADGFWHEGTPSYHKDTWMGLVGRMPARYPNLDLAARYARQHERIRNALFKLTFPMADCAGYENLEQLGRNPDYAKVHDSSYPHHAWWHKEWTGTQSVPRILGCFGHAVLGTTVGTSDVPRPAELHLHYSGTHGHEHRDALNIILFAHGRELISETKYRRIEDGVEDVRFKMTAAHNAVVIGEENQHGRLEGHRRDIDPDDKIDGIPLLWQYRDYGHGDSLNDPKLRCFCPEWDPVQVAEAEAERAYSPKADMYRRTVALVHAGEEQVYALDIFRVDSGKVHDWMLHGCLQLPYKVFYSGPELSEVQDKLHNEEPGFLFAVVPNFQKDLEAGALSGDFRQEFEKRCIPLSLGVTITTEDEGRLWLLTDDTGQSYTVAKSDDEALNIYGEPWLLHQLRRGETDHNWKADFVYEHGANLHVRMLGQPATKFNIGRGPGMRREGCADFIDVRRPSGESCFIAVHNPYVDEPLVDGIEAVPWGSPNSMYVGLRVRLKNGYTDIVLSSPEDPPFATHTISAEHTKFRDVEVGDIVFAGRFAHIRFQGGQLVHAYGVDTSRLEVRGKVLTGPGSYRGDIIRTHRVEAGAERDAFEVTFDPDSPHPGAGDLEKLRGRCLVVDLGGVLTQAFIIEEVKLTGSGALIYSQDEPGIEIREDGALIKMMYYPGWGIRGKCRFHIADSLLWTSSSAE